MESRKTEMDKLVRELRGNLSQKKLAELSGVSQQAIAQYELGRFPKPEILEKLAAATGHRIVITIEKIEEQADQ